LKEGWGKPAPDGSDAYIRYVGKFKDTQRVFEDNTKQKPPFKFLVGHFRVIRAIDIAVAAMKIGEKCLLRTTSRYAFGEKGEGRKIAPNKDLDYELEVIDWNDWKRVNNKDGVRKRVLKQGEGDMYDVPDASAICDITYTAQIFPNDDELYLDVKDGDEEKYPDRVFSCGRHIEFMVNDDPTFPEGFHEALKSMNKYEIAEFKIEPSWAFGEKGVTELGIGSNQSLYYRIHMHNYQNLMSRWKMEPEQLFDVANRFKRKAKEYFELGNWDYAFQRYEKALEYFEADEKMDHEEKKQAADDITIVHNNLAMIHLKRNEFLECIREANKVIKADKDNIKAWCRKGQARSMLADYKKADDDLRHAQSLDKKNKFIKRCIKRNKKKKKQYNDNQKKTYGGMFDKYNQFLKDKEDKQQKGVVKALDTSKIREPDIDEYDSDDSQYSSVGSIDFEFDDMDDGDKGDDDESSDNDNNNNNNDNNDALEAINEED